MSKPKHLRIHQMTIAQFEAMFPDEDACKAYLTRNRWPDGVIRCPRCGFDKVFEHKRPFHWNCYNCSPDGIGYRFSVLVGTIFENTNKPLRQWFRVMHMMLTARKASAPFKSIASWVSVPTKPRSICATRFALRSATLSSSSWSAMSKWTKHMSG